MSVFLKLVIVAFTLVIGQGAMASSMKVNYIEIADAEVKTWQAYYLKDAKLLQERTAVLLKAQYNIQDPRALHQLADSFFAAYFKFAAMPQDSTEQAYQQEILPLVVSAYQQLKEATNATWNAADAARADLSWWVVRRQGNLSNPEFVGKRIANFYRVIYGANDPQGLFNRAGYLRAVAANYRDLCQDHWGGVSESDWQIIRSLLEASYGRLAQF